MGFFDKVFGAKGTETKSTDGKTAAEFQGDDLAAALSLQAGGELDKALGTYLKLAEKHPLDILIPFFMSSIMAEKGSVVEAAQNLRELSRRIAAGGDNISRAITLELAGVVQASSTVKLPAVAELAVSFGDRLKAQGFLQESAVCFEIAAGIAQDNAHVLHKFADTLHDLRMYEYAEAVLQEALKCAPNHWGALYTYAVLLQDLGRLSEALSYYESALKLDPNHVNCQNNYGSALMMVKRIDEALEHCTLAAELDPNAPQVQLNLGNIYLLKQEYDKARSSFDKAISLHNHLAPAYFGLGVVEQVSGHPERSRELFTKAIELNPSAAEFHHALGNLLARQKDPEALSHFATAAQLQTRLQNLHTDFAIACLNLGRREEGLEHLKTALEQNPDDAVAREILSKELGENSGS